MFEKFFEILKNRAKIHAVDVVLEILINTLQEYRRANNSGEFDVNRSGYVDKVGANYSDSRDNNHKKNDYSQLKL